MILRSLAVEGWKCFANRVQVARFGERINVVHGPNAVGKSTLFEALVRGFIDSHRVTGEDAAAMRPWGRSLAPTVEIEFEHGGMEYRLRKRFLDRPFAELERRESGAFVRLAEADGAEDRARRFLNANPPGRGLCHSKHWGIAQVLWTLQGQLALGELSGELPGDIRSMLGAQVAGPAAGRLEQRIDALFAEYFTPGGALKKGQNAPEVVRLRDQLTKTGEDIVRAQSKLQEFEDAARRLEDLRAGQNQLRRDAASLNRAVHDAEQRARIYLDLKNQQAQQAQRTKAAEARSRELRQRIDELASLVRLLDRGEKSRAGLAGELPEAAKAASAARDLASTRKSELEDARAQQAAVEAARSEAALARKYSEALAHRVMLRDRLDRIDEAEAAVVRARQERAEIIAPEAGTLRSIRKAIKERDEANARLEAALIKIEFVSAGDAIAAVLVGEAPGRHQVRPGQAIEFKGTPEVVVELEGVGRFRASGPAVDVAEDRKQYDRACRRLESLTEPFGCADPDRLEVLHESAKLLDSRLKEKSARLEGLLAGDDAGALRQQLAGTDASASMIGEQRPGWIESPPDPAALDQQAVDLERRMRQAVAAAESAWESAEEHRRATETREAEIAARMKQLQTETDGYRERLRLLTSDGKTDEARRTELDDALLALEAAKVALEKVDTELAAFPADPADEAGQLRRQLKAADDAVIKALADEKREEGRLSNLAAEGPYSRVTQLAEQAEALSSRIERENLRLEAIRLLRQTVVTCRSEAVALVAAPVERAATMTLQRIAGRRLGAIRLDDGFSPAGVCPEIAEGAQVAVDAASGGEKEQIFLATRLALADLLARDERQPVVLDDVLVATDTGRLSRTLTILDEAADRLQVIILTCHPERYGSLAGASFFDLEEILARKAEAAAR